MSPRSPALPLAPVLVLSLALLGCGRSCDRDRPYVPFAIDGDGGVRDATVVSTAPLPPADDAGGLVAPPDATRWTIQGRTIDAPPGNVFLRAISGDFDGDGVVDLVVTARNPEEKSLARVLYHPGKGTPSEILDAEKDTLPDASCSPVERLSAVGKGSVLVDVSAVCAGHTTSTLPRLLTLVALDKGAPRPRFSAKIGDLGVPLSISATVTDRDHDGIDDLALRFDLDGKPPELVLWFLNRPAGLSRDPDTPEESLRAFAKDLDVRSTKPKGSETVAAGVDAMRQLYRAVCPEGGGPRVRPTVGAFTCGASASMEVAQLAEVKALAAFGDPVRAIHAQERLGRSPLPRTKERLAEAERVVELAAPSRPGRLVKVVAAEPDAMPREPAFGPLAFDSQGLLVLSHAAVVRVDAKGDESPTTLAPWSMTATAPDGSRLLEAYDPCDGTWLHMTFADPNGTRDAELPIAPELGARCAARGEGQRTALLGYGPRGLELLVAGQPVSAPWTGGRGEWLARTGVGASPTGSARSAGGHHYAAITARGVVVRGEKAVTVRSPDLADASFCTVDDEGKHVACVRKGRAMLVEF